MIGRRDKKKNPQARSDFFFDFISPPPFWSCSHIALGKWFSLFLFISLVANLSLSPCLIPHYPVSGIFLSTHCIHLSSSKGGEKNAFFFFWSEKNRDRCGGGGGYPPVYFQKMCAMTMRHIHLSGFPPFLKLGFICVGYFSCERVRTARPKVLYTANTIQTLGRMGGLYFLPEKKKNTTKNSKQKTKQKNSKTKEPSQLFAFH